MSLAAPCGDLALRHGRVEEGGVLGLHFLELVLLHALHFDRRALALLVDALLHDRGVEFADLLGHLVFEFVLDVELFVEFLKGIFRFIIGCIGAHLPIDLKIRLLRVRVPVLFGRIGGLSCAFRVLNCRALLDGNVCGHVREANVGLGTLLIDGGRRCR